MFIDTIKIIDKEKINLLGGTYGSPLPPPFVRKTNRMYLEMYYLMEEVRRNRRFLLEMYCFKGGGKEEP